MPSHLPDGAAASPQRRFCCSHRAVSLALAHAALQHAVQPPQAGAMAPRMTDRLDALGVTGRRRRAVAAALRAMWRAQAVAPRPCLGAALSPSHPCVELLDGLTLALDCCATDEDWRAVVMARGELDEELVRSSRCPR